MDINTLTTDLDRLAAAHGQQWLNDLESRKQEEVTHSDQYHSTTQSGDQDSYNCLYRSANYYLGTQQSDKYLSDWISRHAPGKVFLDMACGNGLLAIHAARCGASLAIGIDLSPSSVRNATEGAARAGVGSSCRFIVGDVENTELPASSIDVAVCSGMLHHVDLTRLFPELKRVLKPAGRVFAFEPLSYNPIFQWYRRATPHLRTRWETDHIIGLKDVRYAGQFFEVENTRYWHLTSVLTPYARRLLGLFNVIDAVLTKIPLLQLMAWIFTFELVKTSEVVSPRPSARR